VDREAEDPVDPEPPAEKPGRASEAIDNIQVLRGVAAFGVVLLHLYPMLLAVWGVRLPVAWGASGVDVFFVISGFIMVYTNADFSRSAPRFWLDRIIRIAPLYWMVTFLMVAINLAGARPVGLFRFDGIDLVKSLLFLPEVRADGAPEPVLSLGWTLNYEMFFYLVFGLTLYMRRMAWSLAVMTLLFGSLVAAGAVVDLPFALDFYTQPIILEFLAGAALALAFRAGWLDGWPAPAILGGLLVLLGGGAILASEMFPGGAVVVWSWRLVFYGAPALILVAGALVLHQAGIRWRRGFMTALGAASYSLYLIHPLAMQPVAKALGDLGRRPEVAAWLDSFIPGGAQSWLWGALIGVACVASALAAGFLVYRFVEQPVLALLKRSSRMRKPARTRQAPDAIALR